MRALTALLAALVAALACAPGATGPDLHLFAGRWAGHSRLLVVEQDGRATYTGRVFRFCGPGVAPPCDRLAGDRITGGLDEHLTFTRTSATTAYGTIASGTDDEAPPNVHLRVGSPLSLTRQPNDEVRVSDGWTLCGRQAPPGDPACTGG
jgi:hypothetical protein